MGKKIFVSYKYGDIDVLPVSGISGASAKARDYVTWLEQKFTDRTDHIYKGEHDNEDLSDKSDEYIWEKLKDKIYDSTITIVLISPNMRESGRWEKSQWIPWEISYSVREIPRSGYTSHSNAVLAIILPNKNGSYDYYDSMTLFRILSDNIKVGYIPVVQWQNFKYQSDYYIQQAINAQKSTPQYKITKTVS